MSNFKWLFFGLCLLLLVADGVASAESGSKSDKPIVAVANYPLKYFAEQIVGDDEADIKIGKISVSSPISRALIGKYSGDVAEVETPGGYKEFEILDVKYV